LDFLPTLRPAWWVLRGWVAVRVLEVMTTPVDAWHDISLVPSVGDSTFLGFLALLVAIPVSVHFGRLQLSGLWRRRLVKVGEGVLVLFTVGMALASIGDDGGSSATAWRVAYGQQQASQDGLAENGKPISNLYVYDQNGKLLDGVYVYDQDGQPVQVSASPDGSFIDGDAWIDGTGQLVPNKYPRKLLQQQWFGGANSPGYVAVVPPMVTVPQGVHRLAGPDVSPQDSATPSGAPSSSASPATPTPDGATGAHTSSVAPTLPSSSAPPSTKG
jgi:hypothetical protein